jgi:flagella basal body P-ring formation protein FlgA
MMQPRPLTPRKTVQLMVALTILAWATQTLLSQLGYGQTTQSALAAGIIEIRCEATVEASDVTLKDLCKWNEPTAIGSHGDLVIAKLSEANPVRQIGMNEIKAALHDAGVNLSQLEFSGAASCAVRRSDVDDATFARLLTRDAEIAEANAAEAARPPAAVEVAPATKPALRKQLVLTRPLSSGQKVTVGDVATQVLIDKDDAPVAAAVDPDQIIDKLLVRGMKRGEVLTAQDVRPAPVVLKDQFITIAIALDGQAVETVARAMEDGIKGQIIKAKNEATGEVYQVTVTAPAVGELKRPGDVASTSEQAR